MHFTFCYNKQNTFRSVACAFFVIWKQPITTAFYTTHSISLFALNCKSTGTNWAPTNIAVVAPHEYRHLYASKQGCFTLRKTGLRCHCLQTKVYYINSSTNKLLPNYIKMYIYNTININTHFML